MEGTLYQILHLERSASQAEVKRAYRTLATKLHPDKAGGDVQAFKRLQSAYEILSDSAKASIGHLRLHVHPVKCRVVVRAQRSEYDSTGKVSKSVAEEFADGFGGGQFRDRTSAGKLVEDKADLSERITVHHSSTPSHTAGFEAWMRSRGESSAEVYTAESMAQQFGVMKGSYEAAPLPADVTVQQVRCSAAGHPADVLALQKVRLPPALEWGQVCVDVRVSAINPADLYTAKMGGLYGGSQVSPPYAAGHDCVAVVTSVGPGVRDVSEGDWVIPMKSHMGTWTSHAVWKAGDLLKIPGDVLPLEYCAMLREMLLAYRLLEDHGNLKPGDCVMLSAANSTVGQTIIQLCKVLRLRCVAIVRAPEKTKTWLQELGASVVLGINAHIREELDALKFFAKPKLALDAVGGSLASRMSDALAEGGSMVCYGAMCGKSPAWPWQSWVFKEQRVAGFNLRNWMAKNTSKVPKVVELLGKLVKDNLLALAFTEYDLEEFPEALDHAMDSGRNSKILLTVKQTGSQ